MHNISISDPKQDKTSLFTTKTVKIGDSKITTPYKILDFNDTPPLKEIKELDKDILKKINIIEKSATISKEKYTQELENPNVNFLHRSYDSLKDIENLKNKIIVNTLTLKFNPLKLVNGKDSLDSFLDLYYPKSDLLLLPNLKTRIYDIGTKKSIINIPQTEYLDYIDVAYNSLEYRNNKPIFVPIPIRYGINKFKEIINEYKDKGFRYFWIDCEGVSTFQISSHLRSYNRLIDKAGIVDKTLLYISNIRREINPDKKEVECSASDLLTSPLGADILGVNKEPQKGGDGTYIPPPWEEQVKHKARFINRTDYYYIKYSDFKNKQEFYDKYHINDNLIYNKPKFYSNFANAYEINDEFEHQRGLLKNEKSILEDLSKKPAIPQKIIKAITKVVEGKVKEDNKPPTTLDEFM